MEICVELGLDAEIAVNEGKVLLLGGGNFDSLGPQDVC